MSDTPITSVVYNSTYHHGVDDKRRVQVPSMWRPAEPNTQFTLIVWRARKEGACLRVLPPAQMAKLMAELAAMPNLDPKKTILKRIIGSESAQVELDKAGRLCVPDEMAQAVGLDKQATLVGLLDRFEIWEPSRLAAVKAADLALEQEALQMLE